MSTDIEVIDHDEPMRAPSLSLVPNTNASELVARLAVIRSAMNQAMERDVDYGVIPGTNKPALLKPGAEKLGALFQLDVQLENEKIWHDDGHLTVISHATVYHQPTGLRLGGGEGICTTRESKYGWRTQDRKCPRCEQATIKRSKFPPRGAPAGTEPGWYCYAKIGGCGAEYDATDTAITSQVTGRVQNPDLPDTYNTVDKMASKRARIDAVLAVTGASALFTQDVEDNAPPAPVQDADLPEPLQAAESERERRELQEAVQAGIDRLGAVDENWTLEATLLAATESFGREITALADLDNDELGKILGAMPAETVAA
jgi:hypothetical protein